MSLTQDPRNILALARKVFSGSFTQGPNPKPANFAKATGGGSPNLYGASRSSAAMPHVDNRNWHNPNLRPFETPRRR